MPVCFWTGQRNILFGYKTIPHLKTGREFWDAPPESLSPLLSPSPLFIRIYGPVFKTGALNVFPTERATAVNSPHLKTGAGILGCTPLNYSVG
ncbi:MAG: hypothetical protein CRN43_19535 [Candidatus Nephrothrix sp. EaCA]|nr:MAG: hypothetical protein CRN43_19535 [Candidatus Nephrothrix sp. EaCA]